MAELPLSDHCSLREDGTVFPPVTPEVPPPPGYRSPLDDASGQEDFEDGD